MVIGESTDDGLARFAKADGILVAILEVAPRKRWALAERLCAGDVTLLNLVSRLLDHGANESFDETPLALREALRSLAVGNPASNPDIGGVYKVVKPVGHGGSASVYLARRRTGDIVEHVALKLLHPNSLDKVASARFVQEQRILARLRHPGIARILDAGLTTSGQPFFAMEYIQGVPIDEYCDEHELGVDDRLRLLVRVADALAYSHGELVVHRDVKPSNVLVDSSGNPLLLDFGIAKSLSASDIDLTLPGGAPATVGYASPEQLEGKPATAAVDVYQLGMLAYVLVTGQKPYSARGLSRSELTMILQRMPHLAPSVKLRRLVASGARSDVATIAKLRKASVSHLLRGFGGDLDRVVLKALSPNPKDRYSTASGFAQDLRNVLERRTVVAGRNSVPRISRFEKRHWLGALVATVSFSSRCLLALGISAAAAR